MKSHFNSHAVDSGRFQIISKSSSITINVKVPRNETSFSEEMGFVNENLPFSERWADPVYSNSPPPSSLSASFSNNCLCRNACNDFFYFLKIIFNISTSKRFKTYKLY